VEALSSINRDAIASYRPLLAAAGAEALIDVKGSLVVCRTMQTLEQKQQAFWHSVRSVCGSNGTVARKHCGLNQR
jgi:hypothetical protein